MRQDVRSCSAWCLFGLLFEITVSLPHVDLMRNEGLYDQNFQLDRSVIGNMKNGAMPHIGAHEAQMRVQISHKHAQIAEISIGSPGQKMRCLLDSGSSDLWVPSKRCEHCMNNNYYDADASSTFDPVMVETFSGRKPQAVKISYGSGQVTGYAVSDRLGFGSVEIPSQDFIIVEDAALPGGRSWDGICGLGWKALAQFGTTLYENIQAAGTKAVFAIVPSTAARAFPTGQSHAHMLIGEVPEAAYEPGTLVWTPAQPFEPSGGVFGAERTFWVIDGGLQINRPRPVPARFLVDTGTNQVLLVPQKYYQNFIRSLIPTAVFDQSCGHDLRAGVVCDCDIQQRADLKPLKITLGGRAFALPVSEMFQRLPAAGGGDLCLLTVQPNHMSGGMGSISDVIGGLVGSLFGPSTSSNAASQRLAVVPNRSGLADVPTVPFKLPLQAPMSGAAVAHTNYSSGRLCKETAVVHVDSLTGHQVVSKDPASPLCDVTARRLTASQDDSLGSILDSIFGDGSAKQQGGVHNPTAVSQNPIDGTMGVPPTPQGGAHAPSAHEQPPWGGSGSESSPLGGILDSILGDGSLGGHHHHVAHSGSAPASVAQPQAMDEPWMIGGVFLEHFVTIFDFDNARLGFAEPAQGGGRRLNDIHV